MRMRFEGIFAVFSVFLAFPSPGHAKEYRFFHENVLGTSLEVQMEAEDPESAQQGESRLLAEIDRLNGVYSEYDQSSELSRLLQTPVGNAHPISRELASTLNMCEHWTLVSGGAFNPAVAALSQTWEQAENKRDVPPIAELAVTLDHVRKLHWQIDDAKQQVTRTSDVPLSLNAIAKGVILDRVVTMVLESDARIQGVLLNIGGDIRIAGNLSARIAIADPMCDAIGSPMTRTIVVTDGAVATSGSSERYFEIAGQKYSHIIDPRSGKPVSETVSTTVIAKDASTADAVATICSVLSISESLGLVESLAGVECLLITAAGIATTSA